jgi:hypothetical protein
LDDERQVVGGRIEGQQIGKRDKEQEDKPQELEHL